MTPIICLSLYSREAFLGPGHTLVASLPFGSRVTVNIPISPCHGTGGAEEVGSGHPRGSAQQAEAEATNGAYGPPGGEKRHHGSDGRAGEDSSLRQRGKKKALLLLIRDG